MSNDKAPAISTAATIGEVFENVVDEVQEVYRHSAQGSPRLDARDLRNLPALASKLKNSVGGVSIHLRGRLADDTRKALDKWESNKEMPDTLRQQLLDHLNVVIESDSFYSDERFKEVNLRPQTERLRGQVLQREDLALLNRLLLEDAYPDEVWRLSPSAGAVVNAVDIELNFKSVKISEKGWVLLGKDTNQSEMEIKLATRLTPSGNPIKAT